MSEENKQQLGYRPSIKYDEDYKSKLVSSNINNSNVGNDDSSNEEEYNPIEDLGSLLDTLDTMINQLPNNINNSINNVFDHIKDIWNDELKDKDYELIPNENDWTYKDEESDDTDQDTEDDDDEDEFELEDPFDFPDTIKIVETQASKSEIIDKEYIKHLTDVLEYYLEKLHNALSNFWTTTLIATYNKNTDDKKFILNNILLNSSDVKADKKHLLDFGIRNEIYKNVKLDFYDNLFSREETIMHLKQFKIAYEMRKKYADIKPTTSATKTSTMDVNILKAMTITYDKKYDTSFTNLFRYLNSSVVVMNDILTTYMQEIKTKQVLLEGDGINK